MWALKGGFNECFTEGEISEKSFWKVYFVEKEWSLNVFVGRQEKAIVALLQKTGWRTGEKNKNWAISKDDEEHNGKQSLSKEALEMVNLVSVQKHIYRHSYTKTFQLPKIQFSVLGWVSNPVTRKMPFSKTGLPRLCSQVCYCLRAFIDRGCFLKWMFTINTRSNLGSVLRFHSCVAANSKNVKYAFLLLL